MHAAHELPAEELEARIAARVAELKLLGAMTALRVARIDQRLAELRLLATWTAIQFRALCEWERERRTPWLGSRGRFLWRTCRLGIHWREPVRGQRRFR